MQKIKALIKKHLTTNYLLAIIAFFLMLHSINYIRDLLPRLTPLLSDLKPLLFGYFFSYLLFPCIKYIEKYVCSRSLSILLFFSSIVLLFSFFLIRLYPIIYNNLMELIYFMIDFSTTVNVFIQKNQLPATYIQNILQSQLTKILSNPVLYTTFIDALLNIIRFFTTFLMYLLFTIYFLLRQEFINASIKETCTKLYPNLPMYLSAINKQLKTYFKTFLLLLVVQFLLNLVLLYILKHPYYLLVSMLAGISSFVPYIGPLMISFLTIITALPLNPTKLLILIIGLVIVSNVDSYLITPKVYSKQMQLSPIIVIFFIISANTLFGLLGVIFVVPLMLVVKTIFLTYQQNK